MPKIQTAKLFNLLVLATILPLFINNLLWIFYYQGNLGGLSIKSLISLPLFVFAPGLMLFTVVLVLFISDIVSKLIGNPLRKIHEAILHISTGDLHQKVETDSVLEVQNLTNSFNTMIPHLLSGLENKDNQKKNDRGFRIYPASDFLPFLKFAHMPI